MTCLFFVASCLRRRRVPRLDESIVKGLRGRNLQCTIVLLVLILLCCLFCSASRVLSHRAKRRSWLCNTSKTSASQAERWKLKIIDHVWAVETFPFTLTCTATQFSNWFNDDVPFCWLTSLINAQKYIGDRQTHRQTDRLGRRFQPGTWSGDPGVRTQPLLQFISGPDRVVNVKVYRTT